LFPVDSDQQFLDFIKPIRYARVAGGWEWIIGEPCCRLIKIGFEKCVVSQFDQSFYESVNIPFEKRWTSWYLQRDLEQEQKVLDELNINGEFIFVHDESSTGKYPLRISSDLRQIRPIKMDCEESMFDWIGVIEKAAEIHAISSSFVHLINSLELSNKLYFHNIKPKFGQFSLNQSWQVIDYCEERKALRRQLGLSEDQMDELSKKGSLDKGRGDRLWWDR
jgi:hypothetical protein